MAKRKSKGKKGSGSSNLWKATKIILLLLIGYALGWNFGYVSGKEDGVAAANAASSSGSGSGSGSGGSMTDAYGRSPGHPHYGHSHN